MNREEKNKIILGKLRISITIFSVFLLSFFVPILPILFGYINGFILSLIANSFSIHPHEISLLVNVLLSLIALYFYFRSDNNASTIISAILSAFFINALVLFSFEEITKDYHFTWWQFLFNAFAVGTPLFIIDLIKLKNEIR